MGAGRPLGHSAGRQPWPRSRPSTAPIPPGPAASSSPGSASPASASDAAAIAGHHLFHLDRHNDFPEEATEEAEESLGPAPVLMGTMGIGGQDVALMVSRGSRSSGGLYRRLKVGEALDGYTLLRVEGDRVVMKAGATEVKVSIDDRPRGSAQAGEVRQAGSQAGSQDPRGPAHLHRSGVAEPAGRQLPVRSRAAPPLTSLPPICRRAPSRTENGWSSFPRPSATSGAGSRINPNSPSPGLS